MIVSIHDCIYTLYECINVFTKGVTIITIDKRCYCSFSIDKKYPQKALLHDVPQAIGQYRKVIAECKRAECNAIREHHTAVKAAAATAAATVGYIYIYVYIYIYIYIRRPNLITGLSKWLAPES